MVRWIRRLAGVALLAWAAVIVVRETVWRSLRRFTPLYGLEADTGAPTGIRVNALTAAERAAALELEDRLRREWLQ